MKFHESEVTKLQIENIKGIGAIGVFLENLKLGEGALTITAKNKVWRGYWDDMEKCSDLELDNKIEDFIIHNNNDFLSAQLADENDLIEPDYQGFIVNIKNEIISDRREREFSRLGARKLWDALDNIVLEDDWMNDPDNQDDLAFACGEGFQYKIPMKKSPTYNWLCEILSAIKQCLIVRKEQSLKSLKG